MKVLVTTTIQLDPRSDGKRVMLGGIYDFLRDAPCVTEMRLISFAPPLSDAPTNIDRMPPLTVGMKVRNVLWYSLIRRTKSVQESFFWSAEVKKRFDEIEASFKPDLIVYDTLRIGQYINRTSRKTTHVLYLDDLFSLRYKRMLRMIKALSTHGLNAIGNFADHIPRPLLALYGKIPILQILLLNIEQRLVDKAERRSPALFDRCLLVSCREQKILAARTHAINIFTLPPRLVDTRIRPRKWDGRPQFVFLGALNVAHNAVAIESFLTDQLPMVLKRIPDVQINIIGKGQSETLCALAAKFPVHVKLQGYVDDIDAILQTACAMILPVTFGTGVKIKIIDALRCGLPLITTENGIEGIDRREGAGMIVVSGMDEFSEAMLTLLNSSTNRRASEANLRTYHDNYSRTVVDTKYSEIFFPADQGAQLQYAKDEILTV